MSRIETLRQNVIDAELRLESIRQIRQHNQVCEICRDEFKLAFDLLQTAQRELSEATRGTEVAL